jgi:drug efflux transport system ATP-binding protein
LHLMVPDAKAAVPQLRAALSQQGVTVWKIEPIRPSLEDVFVSLTAAQEKAGKR